MDSLHYRTFVRELDEQLQPAVALVLGHPYLRLLEDGLIDTAELRRFIVQYNEYCAVFPRLLAAVASNIPDDLTRLGLIKNLWEEHGEGDPRLSHRTLFSRLWSALSIDSLHPREREVLSSTASYAQKMLHFCKSRHFLEGLGALGPGTESFTGVEYEVILNGLKQLGLLSEFDLEFFAAHIELDGDHYLEALSSLEQWVDEEHEEDNRRLVRFGAMTAIEFEVEFWDGLYDSWRIHQPSAGLDDPLG